MLIFHVGFIDCLVLKLLDFEYFQEFHKQELND